MAQKKKDSEVKIKFEDGRIRKIGFVEINEKPRQFLEQKTGLIYGRGDFYSQTVGVLYSWICKHGPDDMFSGDVLAAAEVVILRGLAEMTGGYVAVDKDNEEMMVYVPEAGAHYVIMTSTLMDKIINGEWSYADEIFKVETMGKKLSVDELRAQLKAALESEDYELAAKLRDKLNKRK